MGLSSDIVLMIGGFMRAIVLLFILCVGQVHGNVIDEIFQRRQLELADAYWFAGQRYIELNKVEIGRAMQARARQLVNNYRPPNERETLDGSMSVAPAPVEVALPQISQEEIARRTAEGNRIVRIQFNRLLRGFLMEETNTLASGIFNTLDVPQLGSIVKSELNTRLNALFSQYEIDALGLDDLIVSESIKVERVEGTTDDYILNVTLSPNAPNYLKERPWWANSLSLYFVREGNSWLLRAISKN